MRKGMWIFISMGLALGACATAPPASLPTRARALPDDEGTQHLDILAGSYWFRPDHLIVRANRPVVMSVSKQGSLVPHSFVLKAPQAGMNIDAHLDREPKMIRFTPTRVGSYPFYCDEEGIFGSHRKKGMEGVLEVVD